MNSVEGLTLTQTGDYTAHLYGKAPSKASKTTIKITAANSEGKVTKKVILQTVKSETTTAVPELQNNEAEKVAQPEFSEQDSNTRQTSDPVVELGGTNTTLNLEDYTIIAILPAISVDVGDLYEFNAELDENFAAGEKLYWFANPKDKESSDDDEIVEFYDTEGQEITTIPENHTIKISAWLNPGGYYEPVIAVKREE